MARNKRSQKRQVAARPAPAPTVVRATERTVAALCPICGKTCPESRALKVGNITVGKVNYFESIDWDPNKPFGVSYQAGGRGSFRSWEHINPEDAPELFEAMKKRFLDALSEWVQKGWIKEEEIHGTS